MNELINQKDDRENGGVHYRVIGTRPVATDAVDKSTGRAAFTGDIKLPRMIHGKVLRSPHAHARIRSLDTSRAETLPGVLAVVTWRDLWPAKDLANQETVKPRYSHFRDSYFARHKALYCGHPIAAVAAAEPWQAEEALKLIDVDYEVLPPVLDPLQAMEKGSPILHEDNIPKEGRPGVGGNVAFRVEHLKGDPEAGFAQADFIVEREFRIGSIHQGYIEPTAAVADWTSERQLKLWSSTQSGFFVRRDVAELLPIPMAHIQVIPTEPGGSFGGKSAAFLEPAAALLSKKSGRPVRMVMNREEVFTATVPSTGCLIRVKMGATREGRITAATAYMLFETGAFRGLSWAAGGARLIFAPYDIPNGRIEGYDVYVNKPKGGSFRAPNAPQVTFAYENVIDELSEKIGLDPMEFRLRNVAKKGTRKIDGIVYPRIGFMETLQAAMKTDHYRTPLQGPCRGRGIACGWWPNNALQSTCSLGVNDDGSVNLITGSIDVGSSARTAIAMQAAERLSIPLAEIHPITGDTSSIGYTATTGGSRTTFATGIAALTAADELIQRMRERAALLWNVDSSTVSYGEGLFTTNSDAAKCLTFKEVAAQVLSTGGPIFVTASIEPKGVGSAISVFIVDLEVDPETGKVAILRCTSVQDVGKAIHPGHVEGQIQGAVAQGIGRALSEEYQFDDQGRMLNRSFLDYRMPTATDVPMIETVLVEVPNPGHPYGVRGVAEPPVVPPPAAIAIAIQRAIGVRLFELPMTPERILRAKGKLG
jgi:xanthine dehydrogenase molybdenum-binding subunit